MLRFLTGPPSLLEQDLFLKPTQRLRRIETPSSWKLSAGQTTRCRAPRHIEAVFAVKFHDSK